MDQIKKTKIIATLGPSTEDKEIIEKMILEGVDVFRINFSHSNYNKISDQIDIIRSISKKLGANTSILGDLQGPKLRIGEVSNNSEIKKGDNLVLSCKSVVILFNDLESKPSSSVLFKNLSIFPDESSLDLMASV